MSYVVNNHLDNLYVLYNKPVGPGKLINVGPTSIPEARVDYDELLFFNFDINPNFLMTLLLELCWNSIKIF